MFNIFINNLDGETRCTFCQYAADANLREVAETSEGCAFIQSDPKMLENWTQMNVQHIHHVQQ